jgi:hypothetical protein
MVEDHEGNYDVALELQRQSIAVSHSLDFPWFQAIGLMNVAELLLKMGDVDGADLHARAGLELNWRSASGRQNMVFCLSTLALIASARGDDQGAGRLWGAILAEERRGPIGEWEGQARRDVAARLRDRMSGDFEKGVAAGQLLTLDQAVEEALRAAAQKASQEVNQD